MSGGMRHSRAASSAGLERTAVVVQALRAGVLVAREGVLPVAREGVRGGGGELVAEVLG